jgi:hypothetical protein
VLPQEHGDIKNHIDIQVQCVDLQAIGAVYLGVSGKDLAHIGGQSLILETMFNISLQ